MNTNFENSLGIIPLQEAINKFQEKYPQSSIFKLQIEYKGPFLKYEMNGNDNENRNSLELNAQTGDIIREKQRPLKEKEKLKNQDTLTRKSLDLNKLMSLDEISKISDTEVGKGKAFQWEMDRSKERTIWKIEYADDKASEIIETKIDAHDGTMIQKKLKS